MADTIATTKVYDVSIQASDALKSLAELKLRAQELTKQQKALGTVTQDNAAEYYALDSQIKSINKQAASYQKTIQSNIKLQNSQNASLEQMRTQLSLQNAEFAKLGNTEAELARKSELGKSIAETTAELKRQEEALGQFQRSVGNYEKAGSSLRTELMNITATIGHLIAEGKNQGEEFDNLVKKAGALRDAYGDASSQIRNLASDTRKFDTLVEGIQGVTAAYGAWQSVSALIGGTNEELEKSMQKLMVVMGALQSLTTIQNILQKQSNTYMAAQQLLQKIGINQTLAESKALAAKNVMMGTGNIATKAAAAVTWLWNAALSANPVVLVAVAVAGLTAGVILLTKAFRGNADAAKASELAMKNLGVVAKNVSKTISDMNLEQSNAATENELRLQSEINTIKERGGTAKEIADAEYAASIRQASTDKAYSMQKLDQYQREQQALEKSIAAKEQDMKYNKPDKEAIQAYDDMIQRRVELTSAISTEANAVRKANQDMTAAELAHRDAVVQYNTDMSEAAKEAAQKVLDAWIKTSEQLQAIEEANLRIRRIGSDEAIEVQLNFDRQLFELQQNGAFERLNKLRENNAIEADEYSNQYKILIKEGEEFNANQLKQLNDHYKQLREEALNLAGLGLDEQLGEITSKYATMMEEIATMPAPVKLPGMTDEEFAAATKKYEEFLFNRNSIELGLQKQLQVELTAARTAHEQSLITAIDAVLSADYAKKFAAAESNERKTLALREEYLQKQKQEYQAAGLDTSAIDNEIQANKLATAKLNYDNELVMAANSASAKYEAKKKYLEAELALAKGNSEEEMRITEELATIKSEYFQQQVDQITMYAGKVMEVASAVNELLNQKSEQEKQKVTEQYDAEAQALANKYAAGLITEAQYNAEQLKLEKKRDKEIAKIEREQAKRTKAIQLVQAIINTAAAVAEALPNIPLSIIVGALGAVQIATIAAAPLPKAARGMYINGASHSMGGANIEAEGGEVIINRRSTDMFLPLLSAINEAGGGVPFTTYGSDGGYTLRSAVNDVPPPSAAELSNTLQEAFKNVKIITTVEDIRRADGQYTEIEYKGNI